MTVRGIGENADYSTSILANGVQQNSYTQQSDDIYDISAHPTVETVQHEYRMNHDICVTEQGYSSPDYGDEGPDLTISNFNQDEVRLVFNFYNPIVFRETIDQDSDDGEYSWQSGDITLYKDGGVVTTYGSVGDESTITHDTGWVSVDANTSWVIDANYRDAATGDDSWSFLEYPITVDVYTRDAVPDTINTTAVNKS